MDVPRVVPGEAVGFLIIEDACGGSLPPLAFSISDSSWQLVVVSTLVTRKRDINHPPPPPAPCQCGCMSEAHQGVPILGSQNSWYPRILGSQKLRNFWTNSPEEGDHKDHRIGGQKHAR